MSATVSRRLCFIKTKPRRQSKKPEKIQHPDDILVGEEARPYTPLPNLRPRAAPVQATPRWRLLAAWIGGLLLVVGIIIVLNGLAANRPAAPEEKPRRFGGITSASAGHTVARSGGGSAQTSATGSSVEGFLNAPFPKRRVPTSCEVKVSSDGRIVGDLGKCLEASRQAD